MSVLGRLNASSQLVELVAAFRADATAIEIAVDLTQHANQVGLLNQDPHQALVALVARLPLRRL